MSPDYCENCPLCERERKQSPPVPEMAKQERPELSNGKSPFDFFRP